MKEVQEPAPTPPSPGNADPRTTGIRPDYPPPKPKSQTPAAAPPQPEQPMMPVAGAIPQPIPRTTTKGIQPDRP
jgi:hypothetical protein